MGEAADIGSQLPAILLFAVWWALLTLADIFFPRAGSDEPIPLAGPRVDDLDTMVATGTGIARRTVGALDPGFNENRFLHSAALAYEAILNAYAQADMKTLRSLLAPDVMAVFEQAIAERRACGEDLHLTFICLKEARIISARMDKSMAEIGVAFTAEIISAMRPCAPQEDDDTAARIVETGDLWTFSRDLASRDRIWRLTATDETG